MKISKPLLDAWIERVKTDIIVYENEIDGESEFVRKTIGEAAEEIKNEINQAFNKEQCIESLKKFCGKDCLPLIDKFVEISGAVFKKEELDSYRKQVMCKMISIEYMNHLQCVKKRLLDPSFYDGKKDIWDETIWSKVNQEVDGLRNGVSVEDFLQNLNINDVKEYYIYRIVLEEKYGNFISNKIYQELVASNDELVICYDFFASVERRIFSECMIFWDEIIKNGLENKLNKKSYIENYYDKKEYWLCRRTLKEFTEKFRRKIRYEINSLFKKKEVSDNLKKILFLMEEVYATFIQRKIFTSERIWQIYFSRKILLEEYRKSKMYNYYLNYKYDDNIPKDIKLDIKDEDSFCKLVLNQSFFNEIGFRELVFGNHISNIYEYSYNCYEYYRATNVLCSKLPRAVIGENDIKEMRLQYLRNNVYFDGLANNVFSTVQDIITGKLFTSILKEILLVLIYTHNIPKKECLGIGDDNEKGYVVVNFETGESESIWGISDPSKVNMNKQRILRKKFSPEFQVNLSSKPDVEKLLSKGICKNQQFGYLMGIVDNLQIGTTYFEQYVTEMQTGVMISWKLFACTSDLANCREANKLLEAVSLIAKSVGKIHNLETRCWIVEEISRIMNVLIHDQSRRIYPELVDVASAIEQYAKKFNEIYDSIFKVLLCVFSESNLEYLIYWQEKNEEHFSKIKNEIMELENVRKNVGERKIEYQPLTNPVMKDLYYALYEAKGNTKWYPWFHTIWLQLNNGQKWFWEEIELLRKK